MVEADKTYPLDASRLYGLIKEMAALQSPGGVTAAGREIIYKLRFYGREYEYRAALDASGGVTRVRISGGGETDAGAIARQFELLDKFIALSAESRGGERR
jgi:hypothetical protein